MCYADVLSALGRLEAACKAYHNVVKLAPQHVNARLSLAALQQQLGLSEEALLTLDITDNETLLDLVKIPVLWQLVAKISLFVVFVGRTFVVPKMRSIGTAKRYERLLQMRATIFGNVLQRGSQRRSVC